MGRTIITTCGTSLLGSGCWNLEGIGSLVGLSDDDRAVQEGINKSIIKEQMENDSSGNTLAGSFNNDAWNNLNRLTDLSAELASLRVYMEALSRQNPQITLGEGDEIILVHSNMGEGLFCAKVIKNILEKCLPNVNVILELIANLDPISFVDFGRALISIWRSFYEKVCKFHQDGQIIIFNLTGGYKAVAMVLSALCSANIAIPITIIYLHETAPPESLFVMNFQGSTIENRLKVGYCDLTINRPIIPGL